jgi:hypothetical protein
MRVCRSSRRRMRRKWLSTLGLSEDRLKRIHKSRSATWISNFRVAWRAFKRSNEICYVPDCETIANKNALHRCYSNKTSDTCIVQVCDEHKPVPCTACGEKSDPMGYVRRCYACQKPYCKTDKRKFPRDPHTNRKRCCKPEDCYSWKCEHPEVRIAKCGWRPDNPSAQCDKWGCDCRLIEFT